MLNRIAIIGTGISGLGAAYLLHKHYDITIYEKNNYIGGHSRTIDIKIDNKIIPVDTGFIVFNKRNYPNLTKLFEHLSVPIVKSNMSFGVSINNGLLEYGTSNIGSIFSQKKNIFNYKFWLMLFDILKFNLRAKKFLHSKITLQECLKQLGVSEWFINYYLLAMGASIWSTPASKMLNFPAQSFLRFFDNHGLLTITDQPQWYTVKNGSKEYVSRLIKLFNRKIQTNNGIKKIIRKKDFIELVDSKGNKAKYDQVIFACHSDQILNILATPTKEEKNILSKIKYQKNKAILHEDLKFMPKNKKSWASWVYLANKSEKNPNSISLSYWMNNLQLLNTRKNILATINPEHFPNKTKIFDKHIFEHPIFNQQAINTQDKIDDIQGKDRIWYAGAWQKYGFHEDGFTSAIKIAKKLGADVPWK